MLSNQQRRDWRRWQRLADRMLVLNAHLGKHLPAASTLAAVDAHLQALEAEHGLAVALAAHYLAIARCPDHLSTKCARLNYECTLLQERWTAAVKAVEKGGDAQNS